MKQTAVEWLENELDFLSNYIDEMARFNLFKQAKEMEKQQILEAHGDEQSKLQDDGSWKTQTSEQYYFETFNTNKK